MFGLAPKHPGVSTRLKNPIARYRNRGQDGAAITLGMPERRRSSDDHAEEAVPVVRMPVEMYGSMA